MLINVKDVIQKLETTKKANRDIDVMIGYVADLKHDDKIMSLRKTVDVCGIAATVSMAESENNIWSRDLPRYTASVDAALQCLPDGWRISIDELMDEDAWACFIRTKSLPSCAIWMKDESLPIAICRAAMATYIIGSES